jgi:asparaginyl-tRNA synthetase
MGLIYELLSGKMLVFPVKCLYSPPPSRMCMLRPLEAEAAVVPAPLEGLRGRELARKRGVAKVSTAALAYLTGALTQKGFDWLLPVVFSKSTDPLWPDPGASIEKRIEVEVYGETVRTTQSMIIHKLVACSTAYPRLFILSPNVRIEKRERRGTGWHTFEFTQLDFEVRNASSREVRKLVEEVVTGLVGHLRGKKGALSSLRKDGGIKVPSLPFRVYDRNDLIERFGPAWEAELPRNIVEPVWVTNIPREFYDFEDTATGKWDNYDLFVPEYGEILSGARREWEYGEIRRKMERDGVRKGNYALLLRLARERRLKPSAGGGLGIERLIAWIVGANHIGEVQPFPKVPGVVYDL